jgi:spore maturation protein CgeB
MKKALFNSPYVHGPGAIRFIVASWEEGFRRRGYEFHVCDDQRQLATMCDTLRPEILYCDVVATPLEDPACRELINCLRQRGSKVALNVFWPLLAQPDARAEALRKYDVADVYCGEREPDSMASFEKDTGKQYVTMPQSANPRYHFPAAFDPRFDYDVVFLGAKLPHKRWFNENIIGHLRSKVRMGLFGPGWTVRDNTLRALSKAARMARLRGFARFCDRFRFAISETDENRLYSSAKICVNFHERESDNSQPHHIVNQRTFKIAACGGFQIVDPVKALPKYFGADEIVTAGFDRNEWLEKVRYYLAHEDERKAIQERATARAQKEHMAQHRAEYMERLLGLA